jgi:sec-independent protein translocase protein TatC
MIVYLLELRKRIFYIIGFFLFVFCINLYFSNQIFKIFLSPVTKTITNPLIATAATAPVFLPLAFAANLALIFTMPFLLIQSLGFILPALYPKEQKLGKTIIFMSIILFVFGSLFSFYLILPWMFHWFYKTMPIGINWLPEINSIINFMTRMLIIFGVILFFTSDAFKKSSTSINIINWYFFKDAYFVYLIKIHLSACYHTTRVQINIFKLDLPI